MFSTLTLLYCSISILMTNSLKSMIAFTTAVNMTMIIYSYDHIPTHSFYKSVFFITSGVLISCTGTQDLSSTFFPSSKQYTFFPMAFTFILLSNAAAPFFPSFMTKELSYPYLNPIMFSMVSITLSFMSYKFLTSFLSPMNKVNPTSSYSYILLPLALSFFFLPHSTYFTTTSYYPYLPILLTPFLYTMLSTLNSTAFSPMDTIWSTPTSYL